MKIKSSLIRCPNCGIFTENSDYCKSCGKLISHKKKREIKEKKVKQQQINKAIENLNERNFIDEFKQHRFLIVRVMGWLLYSVWFVVSLVGAFLAWVIAMVAAG